VGENIGAQASSQEKPVFTMLFYNQMTMVGIGIAAIQQRPASGLMTYDGLNHA
jgi:hypothetical protein